MGEERRVTEEDTADIGEHLEYPETKARQQKGLYTLGTSRWERHALKPVDKRVRTERV